MIFVCLLVTGSVQSDGNRVFLIGSPKTYVLHPLAPHFELAELQFL